MKNKNKITSDPIITTDIKHISDGQLNRNSPANLKIAAINEIYPSSKFEFLGIRNGSTISLRKRYHDTRAKNGQFA